MASTMAVMAGIRTAPYGENSVRYGSGDMIVTGISTGSWIGIYGASFGSEGAQEIQFEIRGKQQGKILVYMDIPEGKAVAEIEAATDSEEEFGTVAARLAATVTGTHDIFFVLKGKDMNLKAGNSAKNMNPIICADFPEPDVIRVGDTYYMICATMHFSPAEHF